MPTSKQIAHELRLVLDATVHEATDRREIVALVTDLAKALMQETAEEALRLFELERSGNL